MTRRCPTLGQDFLGVYQAEMHDDHLDLLSLIKQRRHSDLLDALSDLRALSVPVVAPDIRNLLEAIYHLSVAWIRSWDDSHPSDRQDGFDRQLRSLCRVLEDRRVNTDASNNHAECQDAGRAFTRLVSSLLDQVAEIERERSLTPVPAIDRSDVMAGRGGLDAGDRSRCRPLLEDSACCSESVFAMSVYVFGPFRVCIDGEFVQNWRSAKSKLVFKYLVTHKRCAIAKERLMDLFWPRIDPESARNNLNVTIYNIRQVLQKEGRKLPSVIYRNGQYCLCPDIDLWTDFETFARIVNSAESLAKDGDAVQEVTALAALDELYVGDFLEEDRYEPWVIPLRQQFQDMYKAALGKRAVFYFERQRYDRCIDIDKKIINIDACDEQVHGRLMTCYARQGQNQLAMRQFNECVEALARELDIAPDAATLGLHERIRRREEV